jgi:hypothetical protein
VSQTRITIRGFCSHGPVGHRTSVKTALIVGPAAGRWLQHALIKSWLVCSYYYFSSSMPLFQIFDSLWELA